VLKAREILIISFEGVPQLFSATVLEADIDVFIKTMGYFKFISRISSANNQNFTLNYFIANSLE
jgi:hypothetical protein